MKKKKKKVAVLAAGIQYRPPLSVVKLKLEMRTTNGVGVWAAMANLLERERSSGLLPSYYFVEMLSLAPDVHFLST